MGFYYIMQNFQGERLIAAVAAVAGSQLLLDLTIQYAKDRQAFGRPIIKFQVNRHKIDRHGNTDRRGAFVRLRRVRGV